MDTSETVTQILSRTPGVFLEKTRFGRSESEAFWVNDRRVADAAGGLKNEGGFDWLENLSAMQVEDSIVFTYFLRNSAKAETTILRASVQIGGTKDTAWVDGETWVRMRTVSRVWEMAGPREAEIARLFGVRFIDENQAELGTQSSEEREAWKDFPLRKSFDVVGTGEGGLGPGGVSP